MFKFSIWLPILIWIACSSSLVGDETGKTRTWIDSTGKYKIEASLVKKMGDQVHLQRKDNGKIIKLSVQRLSQADQAYLEKLTTQNDSKGTYAINERVAFSGSWNNRKYRTSGALRCSALVKDGKTWKAKFDGTGVYGKFSYDVEISTRENGKQIQLQGNSTVSGHRYKWTGSVKKGVLTGKYTASNGNNGTFRLEQVK